MIRASEWADKIPAIMEADSKKAAIEFVKAIQKDALDHFKQEALALNDGHPWPITRILDTAIKYL